MATPVAYVYNGTPSTSDAALVTASGTPVVFSHLIAVNTTGSAATITLSVNRSVSGVVETIASALSLPAHSAVSLEYDRLEALGEIVLDSGDTLHGLQGTSSAITVTAF